MIKNILIFSGFIISVSNTLSQNNQHLSKYVLFLGNSYTSVNNLPLLLHDLSLSAGDTLHYDSNVPGGYAFEDHFSNTTSTSKIAQGNWDFVVLQEQSQRPSYPDYLLEVQVLPFARKLDSLINLSNSCTETIFYMTWGRKNGDAIGCPYFPPVCTYSGMDSLLYLRYMQMSESNHAIVSPVGRLWHYIRDHYPNLELYSADESHPSLAGSYAAACSFYSMIFRKSPLLITDNYSLSQSDAEIIRNAAKQVVFDSLSKYFVGTYDPIADFDFMTNNSMEVNFNNASQNSETFEWNFGDGNFSNDENPSHIYTGNGTYNVQLITSNCELTDTLVKSITIGNMGISDKENRESYFYPNPVLHDINLNFETDELEYKILGLEGKVIKQGYVSDKKINIQNLDNSFYILEVKSNNQLIFQSKFFKN